MNARRIITHFIRRRTSDGVLRDERGAAAIEFAIVAVPFFALIFVIMEAGINFFAASSLDNALRLSTRAMQTGSAQAANMTEQQFRGELCGRLPSFMDCDRVKLDLRPIRLSALRNYLGPSPDGLSGDIKSLSPFDETGRYCAGNAGDYMIARALFELPNFFGMAISRKVAGPDGEKYVVEAARVFRNEPFSTGKIRC